MSELEVNMHPTGAAFLYPDEMLDENLPGQLNLTYDEVDNLRWQLYDVWLNSHGMERVGIPAAKVEKGDIIPTFGLAVTVVIPRYPYPGMTTLGLGSSRIQIPSNLEITVHRRIA